jgi:chromosome partitioning protein
MHASPACIGVHIPFPNREQSPKPMSSPESSAESNPDRPGFQGHGPHRIVFANEKGGTGKSTTAVHVAIALAYLGCRVAAIDLDPRQRTFHRYLENRTESMRRRQIDLPTVRFEVFRGTTIEELDQLSAQISPDIDFLIFDTPGRDDEFARHVATTADTLVTPLNDSFIDFDLIGQVDAETFKVRRLSFYAELIWEARKTRAKATIQDNRREMDWVVVRNRTQHIEARNMRRIDNALLELSKRVGFRIAQGLSERVIYRELFPSGLTLLDKGHLGDLATSHLVARQELRALIGGLNLPNPRRAEPAAPAAVVEPAPVAQPVAPAVAAPTYAPRYASAYAQAPVAPEVSAGVLPASHAAPADMAVPLAPVADHGGVRYQS